MHQPPGYANGLFICKLKKTLYGLKQSGRRWYQKLVGFMTDLRFARSEVDQAVFYQRDVGKGILIIVLVHVDDCSIVGSSQPLIDRFKIEIEKRVEITNLGELHWILGIEVKHIPEDRKILLSQRSYIDSILRRYGLDDIKPISTPTDPNIRLTSAQSPTTSDDIAKCATCLITRQSDPSCTHRLELDPTSRLWCRHSHISRPTWEWNTGRL